MTLEGALAFAVMAKAPQAGRVKTRLTPPLDPDQATALGASFVADTLDVVRNAARQTGGTPAIDPYVAYMPAGTEAQMRAVVDFKVGLVLADGSPVADAGVTGIGRSLLHATRSLLGQGYRGLCLISADSPTLPVSILTQAAEALAPPGDRMVLGPAEDGGYYLIGLKAAHAAVFRDIAWSTETVAAQTAARAAAIGLACVMLPPWYDIDDRASLDRLITALGSGSETAPRTAVALGRFGLLAS